MGPLFDSVGRAPSLGQVIARGLGAAHGGLAGPLYLVLLYVPVQLAGVLAIGQRERWSSGARIEPSQVLLSLAFGGTLVLLALVVFFLFPLIQGRVLGRVRDRLESLGWPPSRFRASTRAHSPRLLGNQILFALIVMAGAFPLVCIGAGLVTQEMPELTQPPPEGGTTTPELLSPGELDRRLLAHPVFLGGMVLVSVLASAGGLVYWVASCVVIAERVTVTAAWRQSLRFCRHNLSAVLAVWLVNLAAGAVLLPLGLLSQLGIVTNPWAVSALAVVYSALVGYWGVVLAGLYMSLYLGRRTPSASQEPTEAAVVGG